MSKAEFKRLEQDSFRPNYGGVDWIKRLNERLEEADIEVTPVAYQEADQPPMQITQENTMIYWNTTADEMDAVAIMYEPDDGIATWYFRERFVEMGTTIEQVAGVIGAWCLQTMTLYPMSNVVDVYERMNKPTIPDHLPEDFA